jgi:hypothetical protein
MRIDDERDGRGAAFVAAAPRIPSRGTVREITFSVIGLPDGRHEEPKAYLTTKEAASYLRRSTSWLVKRNDIPFVRGTPNTYKRSDLDAWFKANSFRPFARPRG